MIRLSLAVIPAAFIIVFVVLFGSWAFGAECRGTVGLASWYGVESGTRTANGERFTGNDLTAASRGLPFEPVRSPSGAASGGAVV